MAFLDTLIKKPTTSTGFLDAVVNKPVANPYAGTLGDLGSIGMPSFENRITTPAVAGQGDVYGPNRIAPILQAIPRDAISTGIAVGNLINPKTIGGTLDPSKMGLLGTTLFGKEPIKGLPDIAAGYQNYLEQKGIKGAGGKALAVLGAVAPVGLDFLGVGGETNALKTMVRISTEGDAAQFLMKAGIAEDLAKQFAPDVVKVSNLNDAKALFQSVANLHNTTALDNAKLYQSFLQDAVDSHPGKGLGNIINYRTGEFTAGGDVKYLERVGQDVSGAGSLDNAVQQAADYAKLADQLKAAKADVASLAKATKEPVSAGETLYHGTSIGSADNILKNGFVVTKGGMNAGNGISLTADAGTAKVFAGDGGKVIGAVLSSDVKLVNPKEFIATKNSIAEKTGFDTATQKTIDFYKSKGFDGVDFRKGTGNIPDALKNEVRIWNPDKLIATPPRVPSTEVAPGETVVRPTSSTLPEQTIPVSGRETTTPPLSSSLPEVKHIPTDLATPFQQVVGIGVKTTKEPTLYARVTDKLAKGFRSVVEYVQDSEVRVRKLLEQPGMKVTDASNAYQKATLYPGRVASKIEDAHAQIETMANDLVNIADKSGRDIPTIRQDVNEFLQATHAPERNAALGDGAAGMTNEQAAKALERINASPDAAAIRQVAEQARKLNEQGLVLLKDAGVISEDLFKTLTVKYPNHVPLQRIFDTEEIQGALSVRGFDVKSSGIKTAKGSERQVADILSNIQHNYEQAVLRSEKNIVDQATLAFVRDNREALKGVMEVHKPRAIGTAFDGKILMEKTGDPSYLQMYENGRPIWIKINDPALALAFRGVAREKLPSLLNGIGAFTRFYAGLATRFNPEFAFPNKLRDLQETMIYMAAQKDVGFKGAAKLLTKDPASVKAVWDSIRGVDSAGARMYTEMKAMGGTTGGFGLSTRKQVELDLENMINTAKSRPRQAAADVIQYIDNWNTVFEDSTRLSVYKQALSQGLSKDRAAFLAKEASINFNRMGRGGPVINAIWMFSNASIQGSAKMLRSLRNPKVAATVIATIGAATGAVNEWNDHVDPQWRDKVTKWDRLNGLPIVLPPGKDGGVHYVVIPVSWGVKPIKVMADYAYDMASGQASNLGKMASDLFAATADAYNPLSGTDVVSALTPTIIDVPVEIVRNQSWSGSKIRPDFDKNAPKDVQYFSNLGDTISGKFFIDMTKKIQEGTGVAISPADMKYAFDQYIGGAGKAAGKATAPILGAVTGKPVSADQYPFVSRFYRSRTQEEVGQGAGGDTSVLKSVLENQSRERFYATQAAEDKYTQLKALAPAEASKQWQEIYAKDAVLGAKIADIAKQDKKGLDYTERLITQLGVADGQRALYLKGKFDALKSTTDKSTLWQDYVTKGIITAQVADQISYLMKQGKTTVSTP